MMFGKSHLVGGITKAFGTWVSMGLAAFVVADDGAGPSHPIPGELQADSIAELATVEPERRKLVQLALELGRKHRLNRYIYGSADPAKGGFDCSGSIHFILTASGLQPARSSASQYDWIRKAGRLTTVPEGATLDSPSLAQLKPGDLVFWSGTYEPTDGRTNKVTHVQMYLGTELKTGNPVMIGSSDGRSYRGTARCGFGVFDFKIPRKGSKSRILGYGPPPGLFKDEVE